MTTASQALQRAMSTTRWAVGMCDNFVANMFGYTASGYATATSHWASIPDSDKHPGDMNAPAGALMFWGGGAGHVAISDGKGGIISTDYPSPGIVSHTQASVISQNWGKPYLGWSQPIFQGKQAATVSPAGAFGIPGIPSVPQLLTGGLLNSLPGMFGVGSVKDLAQRAGLVLFGGVLVVVGVLMLTRTSPSFELGGEVKQNAVRNEEEPRRDVQGTERRHRRSARGEHDEGESGGPNTSAEGS